MLHYAIRRIYSPILVSAHVHPASPRILHIHLTTDLPPPADASPTSDKPVRGTVTVDVYRYDDRNASSIRSLRYSTTAAADASLQVASIDMDALLADCGSKGPRPDCVQAARQDAFVHITFEPQGDTAQRLQSALPSLPGTSFSVPSTAFYLTPIKDANLARGKIEVVGVKEGQGGLVVSMRAEATALYVTLEAWGIRGHFSDNAMLMLAGRVYDVVFAPTVEGSVDAETLRKTLRIKSIVDTYGTYREG